MHKENKKYLIIFFLLGSICFGIYKEYGRDVLEGGFGKSFAVQVPENFLDMETTAFAQEKEEILSDSAGIIIENSTLPVYAEKAKAAPQEEKFNANAINLNTATLAELDKLPGIGPAKAQAIIDYRDKKGSFTKKIQVKNVSGIGDATYEKIEGMITVE